MRAALEQFEKNTERTRNLGALYKILVAQTSGALDLSDILRAELVMAVGALDHFVHELVRIGMSETYQGHRAQTDAFLRFRIPLESALRGIADPADGSWLQDQVVANHGYRSFQHPDKIADAMRLISDVSLWDEVAVRLGLLPRDMKQQLVLICDRRNKIVHEADADPSFPGQRWPIDPGLVDNSIEFLENVAKAVYLVVTMAQEVPCG